MYEIARKYLNYFTSNTITRKRALLGASSTSNPDHLINYHAENDDWL